MRLHWCLTLLKNGYDNKAQIDDYGIADDIVDDEIRSNGAPPEIES